MRWVATAQPIDEQGNIGFEDRGPVEVEGEFQASVLSQLNMLEGKQGDGVAEFVNESGTEPAWDITLLRVDV